MDIILGIRVTDGTIIATSKAATRGISVLKDDDDKTRTLGKHSLMAFTGEAGDTVHFAEYIQANLRLHAMRENDVDLSPSAAASFVRGELARSLRLRKPYQVNVLMAGYDHNAKCASLNWIDYLGTNVELPYAAHGYAAFYASSLLDKHYRKDMSVDDGLKLLNMCIVELQTRMPIDFKGVYTKVVDSSGVKEVNVTA